MITQSTLTRQASRANLLATLSELHPSLYALVVDLMTMHGSADCFTDRLLRAAQLVIAGKVYKSHVKSQAGPEAYQVSYNVTYTCECQDWIEARCNSDLGVVCKHSLASHLAYLLGLDLPELPQAPARKDQNALVAWACNDRRIEGMLG